MHLLFYDGECAFCDRTVRFVQARDRRGLFRFASLQDAEAATRLVPLGGRPEALDTFYVVENAWSEQPRLHDRSDAALFVARTLGFPWSLAGVFGLFPRMWRDRTYDFIARHRNRLP
jgi:predicted DCC family thiol-disulfide oxidoreductase YuxK